MSSDTYDGMISQRATRRIQLRTRLTDQGMVGDIEPSAFPAEVERPGAGRPTITPEERAAVDAQERAATRAQGSGYQNFVDFASHAGLRARLAGTEAGMYAQAEYGPATAEESAYDNATIGNRAALPDLPRRGETSLAEAVRDHPEGAPRRVLDLDRSMRSSVARTVNRAIAVFEGREPGLTGNKFVDAGLEALSLPSNVSGEVVADVLKDSGVGHNEADNIGLAVTVLSSLANAAAGGTAGIVARGGRAIDKAHALLADQRGAVLLRELGGADAFDMLRDAPGVTNAAVNARAGDMYLAQAMRQLSTWEGAGVPATADAAGALGYGAVPSRPVPEPDAPDEGAGGADAGETALLTTPPSR